MLSEEILLALIEVKAFDSPAVDNKCSSCKNACVGVEEEHVQCNKPVRNMTGTTEAVTSGKFHYPVDFDPTAMTSSCVNFEQSPA